MWALAPTFFEEEVEVVATAPGKLMVLGEYAVLDGAESLVWAVDRRVAVAAEPLPAGTIVVDAHDIGIEGARGEVDPAGKVLWHDDGVNRPMGMVSAAVTAVAAELAARGTALSGVRLHIDTGPLVHAATGDKLGLGSSAAVVTATTAALLALAGLTPDESCRRLVFDCAQRAHNAAQGKVGSGADIAASTFGGALRYRMGAEPGASQPVPPRLRWWAVWSGRGASTPAMVARVRAYAASAPASYGRIFADLSAISARGCDAFGAGDVSTFLGAVSAYQAALARLGVAAGVDIVSRDHQNIRDIVRAGGGVYKPSGAGGGDVGLAFSADERTHEAVGAALSRAGWALVPLVVDGDGLRWKKNE